MALMLYHRTRQDTGRRILREGFRDVVVDHLDVGRAGGPVRRGVWLADCALDLDYYVMLCAKRHWGLAYCVTGAFCGWLHLLVYDRTGGLTTLAPFHKTPLAPPSDDPPFLFDAMVTLALGGPKLRDYGLTQLARLPELPLHRLGHPSQLRIQHGNGPKTSLFGVTVPDPATIAAWEVPAPATQTTTQTWREWLVPAAVVNALGPPTLFGDEESDAAFGPLDPALFLPPARAA